MKINDPEYERIRWDNPKILTIFGNGLPWTITEGKGEDEWPFFDDRLLPHHTFLSFNDAFCNACMLSAASDMGEYCMGWEL